jgi:inner membrane protein
MFDSAWIWIIVGVMLMGLEIVIPGVFLIWIGMGAVVAGLALTLAPDLPLPWQILVFAVSMIASLSLGFFVQRRSGTTDRAQHLNRELDSMVGERYVAVTDFRLGRGRIRVGDTTYGALGAEDIREGMPVEVVRIENGEVVVRKAGDTPLR